MAWSGLTRGYNGIIGIPPPSIAGHNFSLGGIYVAVAVVVVLQFVLIRNLVRSRLGRAMVAARDNPLAAIASGVSLVRLKMFAFVVSAAMAGLGGAFFAVQKTVLTTDDFAADFSIFFLLIVVVGGSGRLWGPVAGTLVFFLVPELLGALQSWRILVYGVALLVLMLFAPQGIVGQIERAWRQRRPPRSSAGEGKVDQFHVEGAELRRARDEAVRRRRRPQRGERRGGGGRHPCRRRANGSGKTTLLNAISGCYGIDDGAITLGGAPLRGLRPHGSPGSASAEPSRRRSSSTTRPSSTTSCWGLSRARGRHPWKSRCACRAPAPKR